MSFFTKPLCLLAVSLISSQSLIACKPNQTQAIQVDSSATNHPAILPNDNQSTTSNTVTSANCNNQAIFRAFEQHNETQKTQVLGCGQISKILPEDNKGSRHQRMLIKIDGYPQMSVLIAHNIDLASRIPNPQVNTPIRFYGEYIYNNKGGVLHWTHKDPAARHQNGWLEYNGQKYW